LALPTQYEREPILYLNSGTLTTVIDVSARKPDGLDLWMNGIKILLELTFGLVYN